MKAAAWSYTGLDQFINCPRQFEAVRVLKSIKETKGEQQLWGEYVHAQFEHRQRDGTPLAPELIQFEPYMLYLENLPGVHLCEQKVALDKQLRPCDFFAKNVWNRGVLDFMSIMGDTALIVDYKTGKVKPTMKQLALFALFIFHSYPDVIKCVTKYFWTQTQRETTELFMREDIPKLWAKFVPDLKQYSEAFETNVWQPRQSGLCHGWCPVSECEFWKQKRSK